MWTGLLISCAAAAGMLYIPGLIALLPLRRSVVFKIACAPMVSVVLYVLFSLAFSIVHIRATGIAFFLLAIVVSLAVFGVLFLAVRGKDGLIPTSNGLEMVYLVLGLCISFEITCVIFIGNLDGPDSFLQEYDNVFHLGLIRVFLESGDFSPFHSSLYSAVGDASVAPRLVESGFYPAAWHELCAMVIDVTGVAVPVAVNAVNAVLTALVYPISAFAFISALFYGGRGALGAGIICVLAFGSFPWVFLTFGPLYPNLMGYAMVPAEATVFLLLCGRSQSERGDTSLLPLFLAGGIALVVAHPNAVFVAALLLAPFLVWRAYGEGARRWGARYRLAGVGAAAVCTFAIIAIWIILYKLPFFQSTVSYTWWAQRTTVQAFVDVISLGTSEFTSTQVVLAVLVIWGALRAMRTGEAAWCVWSYILAAIIFIVSTSTDGEIKQLLAGFWYTDPRRLGANLALIGLPLAVLGLESAGRLAYQHLIPRQRNKIISGFARVDNLLLKLIGPVVFISVLFFPNFELRGFGNVNTAFGTIRDRIQIQNDKQAVNVLSLDEWEFAKRALELVPEGDVIINQPMDGSSFLFGLEGDNLRYRYLDGYDAEESSDLSVLRTALCDYATNPEVQQAVKKVDAKYVLVLDLGGERTTERRYLDQSVVYPVDWGGIEGINDNTPGFTVVLSEGDMRLYRINR